ncbi:YccF domain-containing protein [Rhodocaloribacter litoris]|uniref:YccF domain-containing protein n=1 Tax=Rhodocaloribacter litoris TaxID=2558931 RepID=UPI00141E9AE0|nr:YccF domain-containing protein [Rhodocaloribacter litoris]QXD16654.1 YccF domain-containing protein [Rhodocaloribacter litoris]
MRHLGNVLWIFLGGGFFIFLEYLLGGLVLCLTVIGIPFGLQCIRLSVLGLLPFGRDVREHPAASGCLPLAMNVIWILAGGVWLALTHLLFGLLCALTVIGIPFARQHMKLARLALAPFGKEIVPVP